MGLEPSIELFVSHIIEILEAVKRTLRKDGVCFVNLGDSYASSPAGNKNEIIRWQHGNKPEQGMTDAVRRSTVVGNLKPKDLCLIPFRIALAAQEAGWWVRSIIHWIKPNPMPSSAEDRPTNCVEYVLMLTKSADYYLDQEAVREGYFEPLDRWGGDNLIANGISSWDSGTGQAAYRDRNMRPNSAGRNWRNAWVIPTQPFGWHMCNACKKVYNSAQFHRLPEKTGGHRCKCAEALPPDTVQINPPKRGRPLESAQHPYRGEGWEDQAIEGRNRVRQDYIPSWLRVEVEVKWSQEIIRKVNKFNIRVRDAQQGTVTAEEGYKATAKELDTYSEKAMGREVIAEVTDGLIASTTELGYQCELCGAIYTPAEFEVLPEARVKVCRCGESDFLGHFATYPEELVEKCVLAATSEKGCCPKCGKPWVRIRKPSKEYAKLLGTWTEDTDKSKELRSEIGFAAHSKKVATSADYETIGWSPQCSCGESPVPCLVLDCFTGTGTTNLVAKKLGRRSIGLELSSDYLRLARARIEEIPLPMRLE